MNAVPSNPDEKILHFPENPLFKGLLIHSLYHSEGSFYSDQGDQRLSPIKLHKDIEPETLPYFTLKKSSLVAPLLNIDSKVVLCEAKVKWVSMFKYFL